MKVSMKSARINSGISQKEMAIKLHVSTSTYRRYEKNPLKMKVEDLLRFCSYTHTPLQSDIKLT